MSISVTVLACGNHYVATKKALQQLPIIGHFKSFVVLVPGRSFPSWSTHQHSLVEPWHWTSSYRPSSLHRGTKVGPKDCKRASRYLRWQDVTRPPRKEKNIFISDAPRRSEIYIRGCQSADSYYATYQKRCTQVFPLTRWSWFQEFHFLSH